MKRARLFVFRRGGVNRGSIFGPISGKKKMELDATTFAIAISVSLISRPIERTTIVFRLLMLAENATGSMCVALFMMTDWTGVRSFNAIAALLFVYVVLIRHVWPLLHFVPHWRYHSAFCYFVGWCALQCACLIMAGGRAVVVVYTTMLWTAIAFGGAACLLGGVVLSRLLYMISEPVLHPAVVARPSRRAIDALVR